MTCLLSPSLVLPCSQARDWKRIARGSTCSQALGGKASFSGVISLEAVNYCGQGLCLNLLPLAYIPKVTLQPLLAICIKVQAKG